MNAKAFALAGLAGSFVLAGTASATFLDVTVETYAPQEWLDNGYGDAGLVTYRIFANFDANDPTQGVLAVSGSPTDPMSLSSSTGYYNAGMFAGDTAPTDVTSLGIWSNQWDTYVTIGATTDEGDATTTSPGFTTITAGLSQDWVIDNGGWFVTPVDPQYQADANNQVLLAQISAPTGGDGGLPVVEGIFNVLTFDGEDIGGVTFSSVPAPGALALLGLAGLAGSRRRRA